MEVYAQDTFFRNPLKAESLTEFLTSLIDGILILLIPFLILALVYIGFRMVTSFAVEGNAQEYAKWKQTLFWTLIGLFIVLGAKGILNVIDDTVKNLLAE